MRNSSTFSAHSFLHYRGKSVHGKSTFFLVLKHNAIQIYGGIKSKDTFTLVGEWSGSATLTQLSTPGN
jgi:hypothetical protein